MGGFANFFGSANEAPFSYEKQRTEETSTTRPDKLTQQMNRLKADQVRGMLGATGGYEKLFGPKSDRLFQLSPQSRGLLNRYIQQTQRPGLTPEQWYRDAKAAVDPTTQIGAAQDIMKQIVTPQLSNKYSQMGLGRSGALGEAVGMAGAQMALPIASLLQQQRVEIERQRPNVESLRSANLQRLQQGFAASDVQRQLNVANWQRKATGTASALSMIPYTAGQSFKGTSRQFGNLMWDLLQTAAGIATGIMGGASYSDPSATTPAQIGGNAPLSPGGAPNQQWPPSPYPTSPQPMTPGSSQTFNFGGGIWGGGF